MNKDKRYIGSILVTTTIFLSLICLYVLFVNIHFFNYHLADLILLVPISLILAIVPGMIMTKDKN